MSSLTRKEKEVELIDDMQTVGAVADFYENEITAMTAFDVAERFEQDFKNIINSRTGGRMQ